MKILFAPVGLVAGLIAGAVGRKAFERVWALIDDEEPPQPNRRGSSRLKLVAALAFEGAIFAVAKGMTDRAARSGFAAVTGRWPGEDPAREAERDPAAQ